MACGTPVIASAAGGLRDIVVHESTGLQVPPGDAGALRESLKRLLGDPVRCAQMGAAGRMRAQSYTTSAVAGSVEQVYLGLLR
jgi:D-inositol-3-phosphate glycosyltransferase